MPIPVESFQTVIFCIPDFTFYFLSTAFITQIIKNAFSERKPVVSSLYLAGRN